MERGIEFRFHIFQLALLLITFWPPLRNLFSKHSTLIQSYIPQMLMLSSNFTQVFLFRFEELTELPLYVVS